jgi:hypothetical protein
MANLNDALLEAMTKALGRWGFSGVTAVAYKQDERSEGYCDTCYHEYTVVTITYRTADGSSGVYEYYGDFGELIRELTNE